MGTEPFVQLGGLGPDAVAFQQACRKIGIKPILGAELKLNDDLTSVTLLALDEKGYGNLCRLVSIQHLRHSRLGVDDLCECAAGIICLINGAENLPSEIPSDNTGLHADAIRSLQEAFGPRLYVTLSIHSHDKKTKPWFYSWRYRSQRC